MRARLQEFLPLVLLALAMQVLAPIAACWATGLAVADPLSAGVICHSASPQGDVNEPSQAPAAHAGACALCCLAQANASLDSPTQAALPIPVRHAARMVWHPAAAFAVASPEGSIAQARAPPQFS